MRKVLAIVCVLGVSYSFAMGQGRGGPPQGGTPPTEAITACENKQASDQCSMQTPRGDSLSGTCEDTPDGKYFACMPEDMKRGGNNSSSSSSSSRYVPQGERSYAD